MTAADMIDWDLAISIGSRLAGSGPEVSRARGRRGGRRAPRRRHPLDRAGPRLHRPGRREHERRHRAPPRRRPPGLDPRQRRELRRAAVAVRRQGHREEGAARGHQQGRRVAGDRRRDRRRAGLPRRQGARPVRPLPRPGRAGCCWWRPTSSTSSARSRPTPTTSGSGSACTRRPTACSSPRCRGCATTSPSQVERLAETIEPTKLLDDGLKRLSEALRGGHWPVIGQRGSLLEVLGTPEQRAIMDELTGVMSLLEGHADVVMDGVGPGRDPVG